MHSLSFVLGGDAFAEAINYWLVLAGILVFVSGKMMVAGIFVFTSGIEFVAGILVTPPTAPLASLMLVFVD